MTGTATGAGTTRPAGAGGAGAAALCWRDPSLRMVAGGLLLFGALTASVGIHQSLVAAEVFGLSDGFYAAVLLAAGLATVAASVAIGIATDRGPRRRALAALAAGASLGGALLVWAGRGPWAFAAAHMLLLPLGATVFGQLFAVARLASLRYPPAVRDGILAALRALFAVPFVVVLPLWGLAFGQGAPLLAIYPAAALLAALHLALIARAWPPDGRAPWPEAPSGLGLRASLAEVAAGPVLARVALVGALHVGPALSGILVGLCFARAGRPAGDVGLFFGAFVALEVAVTFAVGRLAARAGRLAVIGAGVALYVVFLVGLPLLAGSGAVWALLLPAGAGGALIYTLAIAYLQDLLRERPGAGSSLIAVQRLSAEGLTAGAFALGAWVQGYATVAALGAVLMLGALGAILRLDGHRG